jgi:hypothetical protein
VTFFRVTRVYSVTAGHRDPTLRAPANVARMLARHPALATTRPVATRIAGRPATRIDVGVDPDTRGPYERCASLRRCVFLFSTSNGPIYVFSGKRVRFHFVRVRGATVAITIEALTHEFPAFARIATPVVRSVRFG